MCTSVLVAVVTNEERVRGSGCFCWACELIFSHILKLILHIIEDSPASPIIQIIMKRDYYSDVRMAQRIIFESSLYVLSALEQKVSSFTSQKTVNMRLRDRSDLLHPVNVLQADAPRRLAAFDELARDLSRPLGSRLPCLDPSALVRVPDLQQSPNKQSHNYFKQVILRCLERFKNEHEDERSLRLDLKRIRQCECEEVQLARIEECVSELFQRLIAFADQQLKQTSQPPKDKLIQLQSAYHFMLNLFTTHEGNLEMTRRNQLMQLIRFIGTMESQIKCCLQSRKGSTLINYWPQVPYLNQVVHPIMLTLYCCIHQQVKLLAKKHGNAEKEQTQKGQSLFKEISSHNCSKITFINLDGYDTPLNLNLSKTLAKHVQYISFPQQCNEYFAKSFLIQDTPAFWQREARYYKVKEEAQREHLEMYKRLLVFSLRLLQHPQLPDILPFSSTFISFMMEEIVYNQIREFNPTLIIVSQSGKPMIQSHHFESIIKELCLISNMRVILYTHPGLEASGPRLSGPIGGYSKGEVLVKEWEASGMRIELLQQICMFLKIGSGTVSLDRDSGEQSKPQRFESLKILEYACQLFRFLAANHPALQKLKHRYSEYRNRSLLYNNYFQNHATKENSYSLYHKTLVSTVQQLFSHNHPQFADILHVVTSKYTTHIEQHWRTFLSHYSLTLTEQKLKETVKYVVKFPTLPSNIHQHNYDLIALEFFLQSEPGGSAMSISSDSQILLSQTRRDSFSTVYLLNHLPNQSSPTLSNYVGLINNSIENTCQQRVSLKEVQLRQKVFEVGPHQHFCEFNFTETASHVILFWPILYDQRAALLHSFAKLKYEPPITPLIFVGSRANPQLLTNVQPLNSSIIPRSGCTCYQPNDDKIIIFGGFYNGIRNYIQFQADITIFQVSSQGNVQAENIPRSFYLTYQKEAPLGEVVTGIHNEFVRPKVEYQIYEKSITNDFLEIFLLGGVGQKYTRPYSMLASHAHHIVIHNDSIVSIKRIKLNNVVPANLAKPTKTKSETPTLTICSAQNRRFTTAKRPLWAHTPSFLSFELRYSAEEQRMLWSKNYEVALPDNGSKWQTLSLKESEKSTVNIVSYRGMHLSKVLVSVEGPEGVIRLQLNLAYGLDEQQMEQFVNLEVNLIALNSENILAIDISGGIIYALIHHPMYTYGHPILVHSDFYSRQQLQQFQDNQYLPLREIYCFDRQLNNHILKVIEGDKIGILHGCHFNANIIFPEIILKKDRTGFYYCQTVEPSAPSTQLLMQAQATTDPQETSLKISFIYGNRGKFMCFSWLGLCTQANIEEFLLLVDELPGQGEVLDWRLKFHGRLKLKFEESPIKDLQSKDIIDMVQQIGEQDMKYGDYLFRGSFSLESLHDGDLVPMETIKNQTLALSEEEYQLQRLREPRNIRFGQYIDKESSSKVSSTEIEIEHP